MLILYPVVFVVAGILAWRRRGIQRGRGPAWFLVWALVGFLMSFSIVTGLSIGLFVAPVAVVMLLWAAMRSPHLREAAGLLAGIAGVAIMLVILHYPT